MLSRLSNHARNALTEAETIAVSLGKRTVAPEHLLLAIFLRRGCVGSVVLSDMGVSDECFAHLFLEGVDRGQPAHTNPRKIKPLEEPAKLSSKLTAALTDAFALARAGKSPYVGTEHLTSAIMKTRTKSVRDILENARKNTPSSGKQSSGKRPGGMPFFKVSEFPFRIADSGEEAGDDASAIDEFCINLNDRAEEKKDLPLVGRQDILERIVHILGRKTKNNAMLLGDPGVGKTAIAMGLAERINAGAIPELIGKTIYELDLGSLVAGTTFRGEFEARVKDILFEAADNPDIILFIDEIHTLVGAGNASGSLDAANMIKPALARGDVRVIGATTHSEYKKHFEKDAALSRRFQTVTVPEPDSDETFRILQGIRPSLERHHRVAFPAETLDRAVEWSRMHIPDRFLPDKAIDVLDEAASAKRASLGTTPESQARLDIRAAERLINDAEMHKRECIDRGEYEKALKIDTRIRNLKKKAENIRKSLDDTSSRIDAEADIRDIARAVARIANMPEEKILTENTAKLARLERELTKTIVGQKHATEEIARSLKRSFLGFSDESRPLGSFLLLGPTGVGKTHTAFTIADRLFGKPESFIRVNMGEFRERHTVSGLIGAPAGYVGYGEGGRFTERVRKNPHSVVLFDEIEKAHPDILNILLTILENGHVEDGEGRHVSFRQTVVFLTGNIGSERIREVTEKSLGFASRSQGDIYKNIYAQNFTAIEARVREALAETLRPELIDRIDRVLVYRPLAGADIRRVATIALRETAARLASRGHTLRWSPAVVTFVARAASTPNAGARNVKKAIQEHIESALADTFLTHPNLPKILKLDVKDGKVVVRTRD